MALYFLNLGEKMSFCSNCGNEIPDGVLFCGACGLQLEGKEVLGSAADVNADFGLSIENDSTDDNLLITDSNYLFQKSLKQRKNSYLGCKCAIYKKHQLT